MRNSKGDGVNRLAKRPRSARILKQSQNFDARLKGFGNAFKAVAAGKVFLRIIFLVNSIFYFLAGFAGTTLSLTTIGAQLLRRGDLGFILRKRKRTRVDFFLV